MMPFMTQPAVAPACYVPRAGSVIGRSQIFDGAQRLTRTATVTGNRRVMTLSCAITITKPGVAQTIWSAGNAGNPPSLAETTIDITADGRLLIIWNGNGASGGEVVSTAYFRDPGVYPIVVNMDIAQAAATGKWRVWIAGQPVTMTVRSKNYQGDTAANTSGQVAALGYKPYTASGSAYVLLADVIYIDGAVLPPSVFGEQNIHGAWVRKPTAEIYAAIAAAGGWGANGFHLDFSDPLNPGKDVSGKGNHWAAVGFDATGKDTVMSTPSNVYAALNPLITGDENVTYSNGNLTATCATTSGDGVRSSLLIPVGDVYAWEVVFSSVGAVAGNALGFSNGPLYRPNGSTVSMGGATLPTWAAGDVMGVVADRAANLAKFYKNGVLVGSYALPDGPQQAFFGNSQHTLTVNFGQWPQVYGGAYGAKTLCTDNLPEPDIKDPAEAFVQATATGVDMVSVLDAATAGWNGQWVEIIKRRDAAEDWRVRFSDDPGNAWATNNANAKAAAPALVSAGNYVGYRLRGGARYGVWTREVNHTTGTATTVSHGLNTARNVVIATRVSAGGGSRYLRHPDMDAGKLMVMGGASPGCISDASLAEFSADSFSIAATCPSGTYRVVVLAERAGLLSMGNYTGNGISDGAFIPMDVVPHLLMTLETTTSGGVRTWDAARSPQNPVVVSSALTSSAIESSSDSLDFVVGGVKLRSTTATINGSGAKYLGIAWGRPIGGVCVAPATAR